MGQIRRDLPNDEYQAAIGANNPSASNPFATISDVTSSDLPHAVASGTNTYTVTIPGVTAYTDGDAYLIRFTNGSDADSTLDINSLGAINLTKKANVQVTGGDIVAGQEMLIIYDGTNFQCIQTTANQLFAYVTNDDSVTITKGQPVYAFGAAGNRMSVKLANNTGDATSAQTVGLVFSSSIAPNQRGFVITQGVIDGLNTSMYSAGDQLYLGATAGALTNVKPYAPNHLVYIGIVERANAGNGQIYVKPQNGYELEEIHDVDLVSSPPLDGEVLTYNALTSLWEAKPIPGVSTGGTQLLSGGASWSGTGMTFNVSTLTYTIDGDYYTSAPQNVTLAVGDPSNPRFDAIVVDAAGVVSVITGAPAANPLVPSVPGTQVLVQYVLVAANATTPSITNEFVYREGSSPDWTATFVSSGAGTALTGSFTSTTPTPFQGAQCTLVNAPTYNLNKVVRYVKPSGSIARANFPFLSFRVQLLTGSANRNVLVRLFNGGTFVGNVWASPYGLNLTSLNTWQLVVIPLVAFGNAGQLNVTRVEFAFSGTVATSTQIALDDIKFQSGFGPQSSTATFDILDSGVVVGSTSKLNFIDGTNTTVVVTPDIPNNKIDVKIDASAITSLNGLTAPSQSFATSATGVDFSITTSGTLHFFNLPLATAVNTGKLSNVDWVTFNNKLSQAYQTVQNEGTALTQYNTIDFTGDGVNAFSVPGKTIVNIPGASDPVILSAIQAQEIRRGINAVASTTTLTSTASVTGAVVGTAGVASLALGTPATTLIPIPKLRVVSTSGTASSKAGIAWDASTAIPLFYHSKGYRFIGSWVYSDCSAAGITQWFNPNARQFVGLAPATAAANGVAISSATAVSSLVNIVGVGSDSGEANLGFYYNDATGTATRIDLGANFPANKTGAVANGEVFVVEIYNPCGSNNVYYKVTRLSTNAVVNGGVSINLPDVNTGLTPQIVRTSGSDVQNVSIDFCQLMCYTSS